MSSMPYFNSIKVQLKHTPTFVIEVWQEFQFHKGTIKTNFKLMKKLHTIISIP